MALFLGRGEVAFRWTLTGDPQEMLHTVGFNTFASDDWNDIETAGQSIALEFANSMWPGGAGDINGDWTYVGYRITANSADMGLVTQDYPVNLVGTGSGSGSAVPSNFTSLITKYTGAPGRANRGRMYMPCWFATETSIDRNGMFSGGVISGMQAKLDDWLAAVNLAALGEMTVEHQDGLAGGFGITSFVFRSLGATQRRRLRP